MTSSDYKKVERTDAQLLALNEKNRRITLAILYPERAEEFRLDTIKNLHPEDK